MNITTANRKWLDDLQLDHPLLIAGPCSAETEDQVMETALQLQQSDVSIYRAGIWKPRTRPGSFEGVGQIGLQWLQKAKAATGMMMAVEVANAHHVQLALAHDIDVLWIGARTTVNPFAVQEIAEALRNTNTIVLLKNPVNPDLSLWIGGLERLYHAGIQKIGVIHRGFSTYEKTKYRNVPQWQIPIDLKNRFPDLVLIGDPSHISGKRSLIQEVAQYGLDLNYDGLMIETHITPDLAWTDAAQQVTPTQLFQIIKELKVRKATDDAEDYLITLERLRDTIDQYDERILEILGKRMKIADEIGVLKKRKNVAVLQNKRWNALLEKMIAEGGKHGLSEEFVVLLFKAIHQESIAHQEKIVNNL